MKEFARKSIFPKDHLSGMDSIQGILELALWYDNGKHILMNFSTGKTEYSHSLLTTIRQIEKEGYIITQFSETQNNLVQLESINLTISGHKLLEELQNNSSSGKLKKRMADLLWIIVTTILTTLVVLWINGG